MQAALRLHLQPTHRKLDRSPYAKHAALLTWPSPNHELSIRGLLRPFALAAVLALLTCRQDRSAIVTGSSQARTDTYTPTHVFAQTHAHIKRHMRIHCHHAHAPGIHLAAARHTKLRMAPTKRCPHLKVTVRHMLKALDHYAQHKRNMARSCRQALNKQLRQATDPMPDSRQHLTDQSSTGRVQPPNGLFTRAAHGTMQQTINRTQ